MIIWPNPVVFFVLYRISVNAARALQGGEESWFLQHRFRRKSGPRRRARCATLSEVSYRYLLSTSDVLHGLSLNKHISNYEGIAGMK